jgi:hypothetical protein
MKKLAGIVFGLFVLLPAGASAAPLMPQQALAAAASAVDNVRIVCQEDGVCHRLLRRKPVARWVYGDGNFYGPYQGPGYYGDPRLRYRVFPYFWW